MESDDQPVRSTICDVSLDSLCRREFTDVNEHGTPKRYRLISCPDIVDAGKLVVYEYANFPEDRFAAVSYVWRGNIPQDGLKLRTFDIPVPEGHDPGDPVGIEVLREVCLASISCGAMYLWIDRLCIMQTNNADKKWQISQMYRMYKFSDICIVIPGGIQHLVPLEEETQWIHRGWTLQEAVAPSRVIVLFRWALGRRRVFAGDTEDIIEEVTSLKSGQTSLSFIVNACTAGSLSIENGKGRLLMRIKLFGPHTPSGSHRQDETVMSPNVGALARIMSPDLDKDVKEYSIWQSALMRTSSRPVDMVFSIMGLFGVTLDISRFGEMDRLAATIALVRAIMERTGQATWLAAAFRIPPSRQISTFPVFPRTKVSGKAYVRIGQGLQEVSSLMTNEYPVARALVSMPQGSIDQAGYLKVLLKSIGIEAVTTNNRPDNPSRDYFKAVDGSFWKVLQTTEGLKATTFAVVVGFFVGYYPGATPAHDANNVRLMIIQEHGERSFHVKSYVALANDMREWVRTWPEREFSIGGPSPGEAEEEKELPIVSQLPEPFVNNFDEGDEMRATRLDDYCSFRSRWAVSQTDLERESQKE